jgi:acyl carrier protein
MLPIPEAYAADQSRYIAPEGEIEERLVSLWADALRIPAEEISVIDNFFELGGNSLQIMILINKINKEYTTRLMLENLYHTLTVKDLADLIKFSLLQRREKVDASQETEEIIL